MKEILDRGGRSHILVKELGKGGQGVVFETTNKRFVLKIINETNEVQAAATKAQLSFIQSQNIEDLPIAKPLEMLSDPLLGYVMEFAEDMVPLSSLKPQEELTSEWYLETGGILRRIELLRKLAWVLSELHLRGFVYTDLSLDNVFISEDPQHSELFLIDIDNLTTHSSPSKIVYTPFYGAPELVKGNGVVDTYTDCWSFAIIAYELLTCSHPFIGDYVSDGTPEQEDEALRGEIPWIKSKKDSINECSTGIPSEFVIPKKLMDYFHKAFEEGVNDPSQRPSMSEWENILNDVKQYILLCTDCTSTFFYKSKEENNCPFCDHPRANLYRVMIVDWEPPFQSGDHNLGGTIVTKEGRPLIRQNILLTENQTKYINTRHLKLFSSLDDEKKCRITVDINSDKMVVTPLEGTTVKANKIGEIGQEDPFLFKNAKKVQFTREDYQVVLFFDSIEKHQKVISFKKM